MLADAPFEVRVDADARVVAPVGELDLATAKAFLDRALPLARSDGDVTVDLTATSFADSAGVSALLRLASALEGHGRLVLAGANRPVQRTIDLVAATLGLTGIVLAATPAQADRSA